MARDKADTARSGVNEHVIALGDLVSPPQQILHGHPLEHHRGSLFIAYAVRQLYRPVGGKQAFCRIRAERAYVADAITDLDVGRAGADRDHLPCPLIAGNERQPDGRRIHAHSKIRVDEVDAGGMVLDLDLTRARVRHGNILVSQHFGPADLVYSHRCDHCCHSCPDCTHRWALAAMSLSGGAGSSLPACLWGGAFAIGRPYNKEIKPDKQQACRHPHRRMQLINESTDCEH